MFFFLLFLVKLISRNSLGVESNKIKMYAHIESVRPQWRSWQLQFISKFYCHCQRVSESVYMSWVWNRELYIECHRAQSDDCLLCVFSCIRKPIVQLFQLFGIRASIRSVNIVSLMCIYFSSFLLSLSLCPPSALRI